jgi:hypothetical protein
MQLSRKVMQSVLLNDPENKIFSISGRSDLLRNYKSRWGGGKYVPNILPFLVIIFMENRYMN